MQTLLQERLQALAQPVVKTKVEQQKRGDQERLQALSARDPRLGVEKVLQRSPQATKEQAAKALHASGDVERRLRC